MKLLNIIPLLLAGTSLLAQDSELPFRGGSNDGHASGRNIVSSCSVGGVISPFNGGTSAGFASGLGHSQACSPVSGPSIFSGGSQSGFASAVEKNENCLVVSGYSPYSGGTDDGFSHWARTYSNCFGPNSTIDSVAPAKLCQGEYVTIKGSLFNNVIGVAFNGVFTPEFSIEDTATIVARVPAGAGTGLVEVTGPNGTAFSATPVNISPLPVAAFSYTQVNYDAEFIFTGSDASSYSWDFGHLSGTSTAQNPTFTYGQPGMYSVYLEVSNECGIDTLRRDIVIDVIDALGERRQAEFHVRPNPFTGAFELVIPAGLPDNAELVLTDMVGRRVYRSFLQKGIEIERVQVDFLPSGMYNLRIESATGVLGRRVIKL